MLTAASVGAAAAAAAAAAGTVPASRLADRVGRRPVILAGAIGCVVWALPMFGALKP
jgi:MFS family permease